MTVVRPIDGFTTGENARDGFSKPPRVQRRATTARARCSIVSLSARPHASSPSVSAARRLTRRRRRSVDRRARHGLVENTEKTKKIPQTPACVILSTPFASSSRARVYSETNDDDDDDVRSHRPVGSVPKLHRDGAHVLRRRVRRARAVLHRYAREGDADDRRRTSSRPGGDPIERATIARRGRKR